MMTNYDALLALSGGIDSTAVLYRWLVENPDKQILVHHCRIKNHEKRISYEHKAVSEILRWLKAKGLNNFKYTESAFDYGNVGHIVKDIELIGFIQGWLLRSKRFTVDKVLICASKFDLTLPGYELRAKRRFDIIKAVTGKDIEFDYPIRHMDRKEIIDSLPKDLITLCWFCRKPSSGKPCGKCSTCLETLPYL